MKIKLYSQYEHFPNHRAETEDEADIVLYNDGQIWHAFESEPHGESALMIEPRSLQAVNYSKLETDYSRFKYIFTHDSQLLRIAPNALPIEYWNEYEKNEELDGAGIRELLDYKNKDISMICGAKEMCPLHIERKKIARQISGDAEILGDIDGHPRTTTHEALAHFLFSVVIENYIDDKWFTEKLLNCFANKTIPIYFGARNLDGIFNTDGIMQIRRLWEIPEAVKIIKDNPAELYACRLRAIEDNYQRVQNYKNFEDYFLKNYKRFIEDTK